MNLRNLTDAPIHFHSGDARFCGSKRIGRRFSPADHEVTCPICRFNDTQRAVRAALPAVYEQEVYTDA